MWNIVFIFSQQLITNKHCEPGFLNQNTSEELSKEFYSEADTTFGTGTASWDPEDQGMAS